MKRFLLLVLVGCFLLPLAASAETIAHQVGAPESFQASYYSNTGKTAVLVDAAVYVPDVERISTYAVTGRDFILQDVKSVALAAAPDTDWLTDWQPRVQDYENWSGDRDDYIYYDYTFDKKKHSSYSLKFRWYPQSDGSEDYYPYQYGHEAGFVSAGNHFIDTVFGTRRTETSLNYSYATIKDDAPTFHAGNVYFENTPATPQSQDKLSAQTLTWGEARAMAEAFAVQAVPDFQLFWSGLANGENTSRKAYAFRFMRVVDQVPVTFAETSGTGDEPEDQQYASPPDREELNCVIDQGRIVAVLWHNPWAIGDVLQSDVSLLPFEQIMEIFGTIAPLSIQSMENENKVMGGENNRWEISEIRLGYMPVLRRDNSGEWELRPVWDFIGTRIFAREVYDSPGNSALTIDAIDGTVIDRDFGY